jgi:hypothetical protein
MRGPDEWSPRGRNPPDRTRLTGRLEILPVMGSSMTAMVADTVRRHLADPATSWSIGSFGAIAEFHRDPDEAPTHDLHDDLTWMTARGGVRFEVAALARCRPVAYEIPSPQLDRWSHGVALCLSTDGAATARRTVLTELGPDHAALRSSDRAAVLFDLGLALAQCDFCIRSSDPELLGVLRAHAGRSLFGDGHAALPAILRAHPHRVALSALGRVEVFQKIGGPETGDVSPPGPHTHVLPKLLRAERTHSANTPIPDGLVPCGTLYPDHPIIGPHGEERNFDAGVHAAFQALLQSFGDSSVATTKQRLIGAVAAGENPRDFSLPDDRHHRAAVRVALRQLARSGELRDAALRPWRARFEATAATDGDGIDEHA